MWLHVKENPAILPVPCKYEPDMYFQRTQLALTFFTLVLFVCNKKIRSFGHLKTRKIYSSVFHTRKVIPKLDYDSEKKKPSLKFTRVYTK